LHIFSVSVPAVHIDELSKFETISREQFIAQTTTMTATKENRTLAILSAATAGNYGVMAAIAYGAPFSIHQTQH
jgi:hypothetical protein